MQVNYNLLQKDYQNNYPLSYENKPIEPINSFSKKN
jgi:hypothetical protein